MPFAPLSAPFDRFRSTFSQALSLPKEYFPDPNAMSLATVDAEGRPSVRIVLLKGFDERGFVFYTNFEGRKGTELLHNPNAAICFHWPPLETQIRIEGSVTEVTPEEADAYFASRPRLSQIGAWASEQSRPIQTPGELDRRVAEVTERYEGTTVPRPPYWSGFRLVPQRIEFWHAKPSRLHDREVYVRQSDGWQIVTLYP